MMLLFMRGRRFCNANRIDCYSNAIDFNRIITIQNRKVLWVWKVRRKYYRRHKEQKNKY